MKDCPVLVTGAAGCIGAWAVKLLTEMGARPVIFDLTENRSRLHLAMEGADNVLWEIGDITDFDRLSGVVQNMIFKPLFTLQLCKCRSAKLILLGVPKSMLWAVSMSWRPPARLT